MLGVKLPEFEEPDEEDFELFPENLSVIDAFFALDGCAWQYTGMGDLIGLDYKAADIIWNRSGIELDAETFKGVMLFSSTAAAELNKAKGK